MEKSIDLNNILVILRYFFISISKGFFKSRFFKKKANLIIFIIILSLSYCFYFYVNMFELSKLENTIIASSRALDPETNKILISSFYNTVIIISMFIFVLTNSTLEIKKEDYFFMNGLPFSDKEISISEKILNLVISLVIFLVLFIVMVPIFKVLTLNLLSGVLLFFSLHLTFLNSYLVIAIIYSLFKILIKKKEWLLDSIIIIFLFFYVINFRFKIDVFIGTIDMSYSNIITYITIFSIILCPLLLLLNFKLISRKSYYKKKFFNINFFNVSNFFDVTMIAIIRRKNFIYLFLIVMAFLILSILLGDIRGGIDLWSILYPFVGISCVLYADSTIKVRTMYKLYLISVFEEIKYLVLYYISLMFPLLIVDFYLNRSLEQFFLGINISILSTVVGFLFPKSENSINETVSSTLIVVIVIILISITNFKNLIMLFTVVSILILYYILRKESESFL